MITLRTSRSQMLLAASVVLLTIIVVLFFVLRSPSRRMASLLECRPKLVKQELEFLARTRDAVKYRVRLAGSDGSKAVAIYRIPAGSDNLPVVIYLHSSPDDQLLAASDSVTGLNGVAVFAMGMEANFESGLRISSLSGAQAYDLLKQGMSAVRLAAEYLHGHNLVDTSRIFVAGEGVGSLICLPALAANHDLLAGCGLIAPPPGGIPKIARPDSWAKLVSREPVLLAVNAENPGSTEGMQRITAALKSKPEIIEMPKSGSSARRGLEAVRSWLTDIGAVPPFSQPQSVVPGQQPTSSDRQKTFHIG